MRLQTDTYILSAGAANGYDALSVANLFFETGLFGIRRAGFYLCLTGCLQIPMIRFSITSGPIPIPVRPIQYNGVPGTDMKVQQAWNITTGAGITVAILDEGFDTGHAD